MYEHTSPPPPMPRSGHHWKPQERRGRRVALSIPQCHGVDTTGNHKNDEDDVSPTLSHGNATEWKSLETKTKRAATAMARTLTTRTTIAIQRFSFLQPPKTPTVATRTGAHLCRSPRVKVIVYTWVVHKERRTPPQVLASVLVKMSGTKHRCWS